MGRGRGGGFPPTIPVPPSSQSSTRIMSALCSMSPKGYRYMYEITPNAQLPRNKYRYPRFTSAAVRYCWPPMLIRIPQQDTRLGLSDQLYSIISWEFSNKPHHFAQGTLPRSATLPPPESAGILFPPTVGLAWAR